MNQADINMEKLEFGQWKVERLIGSGAFGKVLLIVNRETGEKIAVKKIHRDSPFVADNIWDRELDILHSLKHPGINLSVVLIILLIKLCNLIKYMKYRNSCLSSSSSRSQTFKL